MSITENILQLSTVLNWLNAIHFFKNPEVQYSLLLNKKNFWHRTDETIDR